MTSEGWDQQLFIIWKYKRDNFETTAREDEQQFIHLAWPYQHRTLVNIFNQSYWLVVGMIVCAVG
jgi:hypothetical protein